MKAIMIKRNCKDDLLKICVQLLDYAIVDPNPYIKIEANQ